MNKVINLRTARKTRARSDARRNADANAAKHGLTKAEKTLRTAEAQKLKDHLDGHKREPEA